METFPVTDEVRRKENQWQVAAVQRGVTREEGGSVKDGRKGESSRNLDKIQGSIAVFKKKGTYTVYTQRLQWTVEGPIFSFWLCLCQNKSLQKSFIQSLLFCIPEGS